ncbi:phosphoglycerate mutase [Pseudomonas poae]|uniref:Broad specificity phosphatase PhoE n=1 Tax=Pseudomonas poae TaxID=200451 RepID=A0ABY0S8V5_9PSED|nr:phosphoglycerate mutase [Pseudomonas poae]SDO92833.1 Broad specificity phosphatase PhoE [Pseudomonas poae]
MKHVRLIRHGESAANAGKASLDHASIPLTPKGVEQARLVAGSFTKSPDLIVASPFSRAQATAMQTVAAFPSVPFEIWPIHEFTYLEPERCTNTTVAQRRDWVEAYWAKADPEFTDGEGAESFLDFISRAQSFLDRLAEHPAHDIVVFSHGQLINAVAWLIERNPQTIDGQAMTEWREYEITNQVPNCCGYKLTKYPDDAGWKVSPGEPRIDVTQCVPGRAYQAVRDLERLLIEERAEALSAAGYPLPDDDPAMYAEERLKEARAAARSYQVGSGSVSTAAELSAREVSQVLREVIFGRRAMSKVGRESWDEIYAGHFQINVDGWEISIHNDCDQLDYCEQCVSPDGRHWSFDSGDRFGTDPVALLSTWEHQTLEQLLKTL